MDPDVALADRPAEWADPQSGCRVLGLGSPSHARTNRPPPEPLELTAKEEQAVSTAVESVVRERNRLAHGGTPPWSYLQPFMAGDPSFDCRGVQLLREVARRLDQRKPLWGSKEMRERRR